MAKRETRFSKYANAFYDILYERRSNIDVFVKELLKMGLLDIGKDAIEREFPTFLSSKGKIVIESNKADILRKYFRGDHDISKIAPEISPYFDKNLFIEELMYYKSQKLKALADKLELCNLPKSNKAICKVITEFYWSILTEASSKKRTTTNKSALASDSDKSPVCSYTMTNEEKGAVRNICEIIERSLKEVKRLTDAIDQKQFELQKPTDSAEDERWRMHVASDLNSLRAKLNKQYSVLETAGPDAVKLLEPKKHLHPSLEKLYDIAVKINENLYQSTCPKFSSAAFSVMIADFKMAHEQLRRYLDAL
ncbi:MAG: hypothetical protein IJ265_13950 [Oscillospiraceae bacterium]|nr:hypothetical protein [Oscillospiraceae bacterium]